MKTMWKAALLAGAAWSVAGLAHAQDDFDVAGEEPVAAVEEIVVTARRREEALLDVPVAVTAYGEERLEQRGAQDITELTRDTPSLTLQVARGSNSTLISFIRGVGQQDPLWGFEPGVGLYVDDVYIARPQAAVLDIFDIERIEVLRGPQGTLYGRNTIGGAIKYVTSRISDEPGVTARFSVGSYDQKDMIVSADMPVSDTLAFGAAFAKYTRDGFGTNLTTGGEHYDKDVTAARVSAEWTPTDAIFVRLAGDWVRDDSNAKHGHRELPFILNPVGGPDVLVPGTEPPTNVYDTRAGMGDDNEVETSGVSLTAEWEMNDLVTLKSISAYRSGHTDTIIDFDNLPEPLLDIPGEYLDHTFSQELQALFEGDRWSGVAGAYYLNSTAAGAFDTIVGAVSLTTLTYGFVDTRSFAVFGDFSYDVTEALSVSAGGRWTSDEKKGHVFRQRYLGIRSPYFGNDAAFAFEAPRTNYTDTRKFEQFTPRVSASYEFSPDLTAYASWAQGFKSGGFDMRGDAAAYPDTVEGYDPELVDTTELGLKGALLDRRLTFATAVFDSNYEDMQITTQFPTAVPGVVASVVDNIGQASIRGWEWESSMKFTPNFVGNLMLSYIDAEFDEFLGFVPTGPLNDTCPTEPGCIIDLSDARDFQNTPEWTGSASFTYTHDLPDGSTLSFTPAASYRGAYQLFETASPVLDQGAYWLYDASLVWNSADDRYQVGLHGKNLGEEEYRVGGYDFSSFGDLTGDTVIGFYGPPRQVTLTLQAKF